LKIRICYAEYNHSAAPPESKETAEDPVNNKRKNEEEKRDAVNIPSKYVLNH